ncbi:MAG TPA: DUF935 family protein [Candidatus Binataceae bacterium]|nr:DUF935 family protein [Candidatus Binataceae bacterium]
MALLDSYGRPIQYEMLREEQAAPTLAGIRNIYSIIDSSIGLTPQKIVGVLRQAEFGDPWLYLELAERMEEKDELYQGVLHTRKMAVSQLELAITPASVAPADIADAEFVEEVLLDGGIDLHDAIFEMLDALGKGFSATEIIWDKSPDATSRPGARNGSQQRSSGATRAGSCSTGSPASNCWYAACVATRRVRRSAKASRCSIRSTCG